MKETLLYRVMMIWLFYLTILTHEKELKFHFNCFLFDSHTKMRKKSVIRVITNGVMAC